MIVLKILAWLVILAAVLVLPWWTYQLGYRRGWGEGLIEGGRAVRSQREEADQ